MKRSDFIYFLTIGAGGAITASDMGWNASDSSDLYDGEELQNHVIDSVAFSSVQMKYL